MGDGQGGVLRARLAALRDLNTIRQLSYSAEADFIKTFRATHAPAPDSGQVRNLTPWRLEEPGHP